MKIQVKMYDCTGKKLEHKEFIVPAENAEAVFNSISTIATNSLNDYDISGQTFGPKCALTSIGCT